jgi:hypothetical protein
MNGKSRNDNYIANENEVCIVCGKKKYITMVCHYYGGAGACNHPDSVWDATGNDCTQCGGMGGARWEEIWK